MKPLFLLDLKNHHFTSRITGSGKRIQLYTQQVMAKNKFKKAPVIEITNGGSYIATSALTSN